MKTPTSASPLPGCAKILCDQQTSLRRATSLTVEALEAVWHAIPKRFNGLTFQRLVQLLCFLRNCSPTKFLFRSFSAGFAKSFAQLPISH